MFVIFFFLNYCSLLSLQILKFYFICFKAKSYLTKNELDDLIKPALDYLLTLRYKSGNLPVSLCNDPDRLVQWCHGAAGVAQTYALAYKVRNV